MSVGTLFWGAPSWITGLCPDRTLRGKQRRLEGCGGNDDHANFTVTDGGSVNGDDQSVMMSSVAADGRTSSSIVTFPLSGGVEGLKRYLDDAEELPLVVTILGSVGDGDDDGEVTQNEDRDLTVVGTAYLPLGFEDSFLTSMSDSCWDDNADTTFDISDRVTLAIVTDEGDKVGEIEVETMFRLSCMALHSKGASSDCTTVNRGLSSESDVVSHLEMGEGEQRIGMARICHNFHHKELTPVIEGHESDMEDIDTCHSPVPTDCRHSLHETDSCCVNRDSFFSNCWTESRDDATMTRSSHYSNNL